MFKFIATTALVSCLALPAVAQTFTPNDIKNIVEASRSNEPRFQRDYKGRTFRGVGTFGGTNQFSASILTVKFGGNEIFGPEAHCSDHGVKPDVIADWSDRTRLTIEGTIQDTAMGSIKFKDCKIAR